MCYLFIKRTTDAPGWLRGACEGCWEGQTHVQTHEISLLDCPTNTEKHKRVCVSVCICLGVRVFVTAAT